LRPNWLKRGLIAATFLGSLVLLVAPHIVTAAVFADHFDNMDNWTFHRGLESANEMIDMTPSTEPGPSPPSLKLPPARSLQPDPPGFGDDVVSIFLSNPDTSKLANFTLTFWIHFDDTEGRGGRAMVTFRMQDDRHYYAAYLSDDVSWTSRIMKFSDTDRIILKETEQTGIFAPHAWSRVKLEVQGTTFKLYRDGSLILTASDSEWPAGKTLGIGIYNGFNTLTFHVDDLELETCEPLCYIRMLTKTTWTTITEVTTVSSTTTTTLTSTTTTTTTVTTTSILVHLRLPVSDGGLVLFALLGFFAALTGGWRWSDRVAAAIVPYEFGALLFVLTAMNQAWISFDEVSRLLSSMAVPPLIGVGLGWYLASRGKT
jgi:hypothetical protein